MELKNYYEDLSTLHVGTKPYRAYFIPHANELDALSKLREESERLVPLNGRWKFGYFPNPQAVPDAFFASDFDDSDFGGIDVPGCWQTQGYDKYHYVGSHYIIPVDIPYVPVDNPCGAYRNEFFLEPDGALPVSELIFEGVDSCFYVWINGEFVGYSQGSHNTSIFDISKFVRPGKNQISVLNLKWCDGTYIEIQDKFRMTGIFRDVYILRRPAMRVEDYFLHTNLSDNYSKADVSMDLTLSGECSGSVRAKLLDPQGNELCCREEKAAPQMKISFDALQNPSLWDAEHPVLYKVVLELPGEVIADRIGLREISVKDGVMLVNGKPIKLKGVNRHDTDPKTGYAMNREQIVRDFKLMKRNNINAIRTSHYPNSPLVTNYCDEFGLYVIGEADFESHGITHQDGDLVLGRGSGVGYHLFSPIMVDDPAWKDAILDRVMQPPMRDKNRASIIMWSLGNESGWGENLEIAGRWVKEYDPSRLLHYEGLYPAYDRKPDYSCLDVISRMYPSTEWIKSKYEGRDFDPSDDNIPLADPYTEQFYTEASKTHPLVLCEFIHAMGNSPGDAEDYVELIYKHDRFAGGFVWEWADHTRYDGKTPEGKPRYLYGGDSDEYPTDGNFCMDGLNFPDRRPHTGLKEYKNVIRPARACLGGDNKTVVIRNTLDFTDLADYLDVRFELTCDGKLVQEGKVELPSIAPHESATISLPLEIPTEGYCYLRLVYYKKQATCLVPAGFELGFDQMQLDVKTPDVISLFAPAKAQTTLTAQDRTNNIVIHGANCMGEFTYTFNKKLGMFKSMVVDRREILTRPMEYNIWRAPTDNDAGFGGVTKQWMDIGYHQAVTRIYSNELSEKDGNVVITSRFSMAAIFRRNVVEGTTVFTISPDGKIDIHCDVKRPAHLMYLPRFGVRMFLREEADQVRYFGYGPDESYVDKHHSSYAGLFNTNADELFEDYVRPQENGSHWGCRYLRCADDNNTGIQVVSTGEHEFSFNVSHFTQETLASTRHNFELRRELDTVVCIDYMQSGVGSMACGPKLIKQYRLDASEFTFAVSIQPQAGKMIF